jgi:16S rRNA (guanine(966)-N(2))-methyltransferase RsmD
LRVISGTARGLRLKSLEGSDTRPTLDNVKEAIFSMLFTNCRDATVLDLFAGSGAMGIEALSRGAKEAVFADLNPKACAVVRENLEKARMADRARVVNTDAKKYLETAGKNGMKFDLIFLDPPYALGLLDDALKLISEYNLLSEGGLVVCEFDSGTKVDIQDFNLTKDKRYGRVCVNILEA